MVTKISTLQFTYFVFLNGSITS